MLSCNATAEHEIIGDAERRLICAIIIQALRDTRSQEHRDEALSWLKGPQAKAWLELLELSPDRIHHVILSAQQGADLRVFPGAPPSDNSKGRYKKSYTKGRKRRGHHFPIR